MARKENAISFTFFKEKAIIYHEESTALLLRFKISFFFAPLPQFGRLLVFIECDFG
jgi:hypothetical protein